MTLIQNSSLGTNDTQEPQEYPNRQKKAVGTHFHARITPVLLAAYGKASWLLLPSPISLLSVGEIVQSMN